MGGLLDRELLAAEAELPSRGLPYDGQVVDGKVRVSSAVLHSLYQRPVINLRTCLICHESAPTGFKVLGKHLVNKHKLTTNTYYHKYVVKSAAVPKCLGVGCNNPTVWKGLVVAYREFCSYKCRANHPKYKSIAAHTIKRSWQRESFRANALAASKLTGRLILTKYSKEFLVANSIKNGVRLREYWRDPEYRKKQSARVTAQWTDPEFRAKARAFIGGFHKSSKAGRVRYLSSWEKRAYVWLDNDPSVLTYVVEPLPVPYITVDGKLRNYYPDILLIYANLLRLVEIKPLSRTVNSNTILKFNAARKYCASVGIGFEVWTEFGVLNMDEVKP